MVGCCVSVRVCLREYCGVQWDAYLLSLCEKAMAMVDKAGLCLRLSGNVSEYQRVGAETGSRATASPRDGGGNESRPSLLASQDRCVAHPRVCFRTTAQEQTTCCVREAGKIQKQHQARANRGRSPAGWRAGPAGLRTDREDVHSIQDATARAQERHHLVNHADTSLARQPDAMFTTVSAAALAIPELVLLVVRHLGEQADLARVCRLGDAWQAAALPRLYHTMTICDLAQVDCRGSFCKHGKHKAVKSQKLQHLEHRAHHLRTLRIHHVDPAATKAIIAAAAKLDILDLCFQPSEELEAVVCKLRSSPGYAPSPRQTRFFPFDPALLSGLSRRVFVLTLDFATLPGSSGTCVTGEDIAEMCRQMRDGIYGIYDLTIKGAQSFDIILRIAQRFGECTEHFLIDEGTETCVWTIEASDWSRLFSSMPDLEYLHVSMSLTPQSYHPRSLPQSLASYSAYKMDAASHIELFEALFDPTFLPKLSNPPYFSMLDTWLLPNPTGVTEAQALRALCLAESAMRARKCCSITDEQLDDLYEILE